MLYLYKNKKESGVFELLNEMDSLDLDEALINEYLSDLCEGKVNDMLIDYVDELYDEIENKEKNEKNCCH